jgi:hypothetical protein
VYDTRTDLNATDPGYAPAGRSRVHRLRQCHAGAILAAFDRMQAGDLVVLIQSTSFRMDAYRIRIELFKRGLKVIEHVHLSRMPGEQGLHYIDSLAYDPAYYRGVGHALKARIDSARHGVVDSGKARSWCSPRRSNRPS